MKQINYHSEWSNYLCPTHTVHVLVPKVTTTQWTMVTDRLVISHSSNLKAQTKLLFVQSQQPSFQSIPYWTLQLSTDVTHGPQHHIMPPHAGGSFPQPVHGWQLLKVTFICLLWDVMARPHPYITTSLSHKNSPLALRFSAAIKDSVWFKRPW